MCDAKNCEQNYVGHWKPIVNNGLHVIGPNGSFNHCRLMFPIQFTSYTYISTRFALQRAIFNYKVIIRF